MSPHKKGKEQAPVTLKKKKNIGGEKPTKPRGRGEGKKMADRT